MVLRFALSSRRIDPWDPIHGSTFRLRGKLYGGKLITILQSDNTSVALASLSSTALLRYTWSNTRFDHAIIADGIHVTIIGTRSDGAPQNGSRFCARQLRRWRNGEPQPVVERAIIARVSANARCKWCLPYSGCIDDPAAEVALSLESKESRSLKLMTYDKNDVFYFRDDSKSERSEFTGVVVRRARRKRALSQVSSEISNCKISAVAAFRGNRTEDRESSKGKSIHAGYRHTNRCTRAITAITTTRLNETLR